MIHSSEVQNSACLDSLSKERLITDTWDYEVTELWPLQVTGNTGKIDVCLNKCVRVGAGILALPHIFESTEAPDQQPAPPQYEPS